MSAPPTSCECTQELVACPELDEAPWLISASNDGDVRIWNTCQVKSQDVFECKASAQLHSNGIFSMHALPDASGPTCNLLTASKDGSVKLSCLNGSGHLSVMRTWANLHGGHVVKSVRWKAENIALSSGNDRCLLAHYDLFCWAYEGDHCSSLINTFLCGMCHRSQVDVIALVDSLLCIICSSK
jgi:WD40 repeat protein